jgi:hypothetical protein
MTGDKNDGQHRTHAIEMLLQFQAAHARHANIQHEAAGCVELVVHQEFARARKHGRLVSDGA